MKFCTTIITLILFGAFLFISLREIAMSQTDSCGTMGYLAKQKKNDPTLEVRMRQQEESIEQWIAEQKTSPGALAKTSTVITIPVVVHIIYNTAEENIPNQRVYDQIAITNRDFAGLNPHGLGAFPPALKANTNIQFCMAQKKLDGSPTNGIERRQTSVTGFSNYSDMKFYSTGGLDAWDPTVYMNIWVCNMLFDNSGGYVYSGFAQFPGTGVNATYGVVARYGAFGPTDSTYFRGSGTTITHELGHCLNVRHIWGDDTVSCAGTDFCGDTPNQAGRTVGTNSGVLTDGCTASTPGIMYMNFMDYSDDIVMANYTPDQSLRMHACFASPDGPLLPLLSSTGGAPPSSCEIPTALRMTAVTRTTATLAWTAMYNSIGYNIRYRKVGVATWINTTSATSTKLITGLTKGTNYEFQLQNICSGNSAFSSSCLFSTPKTGPPKEGEDSDPMVESNFRIYPNPSTGMTSVLYTLTEPGTVSVKIADALGAEVTTLVANQMQDEGVHVLDFDTERLVSGVYFIRISTGATMEMRRFVVQR